MTTPHVSVIYRPGEFVLPARYAGKVPAGRLASTAGDNIAEAAGRLCYDSLTSIKGRPTPEYHAHIRETAHNSVYAHCVETFEYAGKIERGWAILAALVGRPGVWITSADPNRVRFAVSLRAVIEWECHGVSGIPKILANALGRRLVNALTTAYPFTTTGLSGEPLTEWHDIHRVAPELPTEQWLSLYIEGISRDLHAELIRHHYQANPSVRSTRYCDEGESNQILHPALVGTEFEATAIQHFANARQTYRDAYQLLTAKGVDKKTARGAARSLLPGATETRMVYSLSRAQAKHILHLRADQGTGSADPEIVRLAHMMRTVLHAEDWTDV